MPNEEIITALRNSVERGESLQTAMQIMVNSGYNPREVQAASKYIGGAPVNMQAKPGEQLTMPEKKGFFSRFKRRQIKPGIKQPVRKETKVSLTSQPSLKSQPPQLPPLTTQRVSPKQEARQIRQQITEPKPILPQVEISDQEEKVPLAKQLNKLTPKKHSHVKEIMLLIILLILIGLLITTILLKDTIMGWFS